MALLMNTPQMKVNQMTNFKITLERKDGTWAEYFHWAENATDVMRFAARSLDIGDPKAIHIVEMPSDDT